MRIRAAKMRGLIMMMKINITRMTRMIVVLIVIVIVIMVMMIMLQQQQQQQLLLLMMMMTATGIHSRAKLQCLFYFDDESTA